MCGEVFRSAARCRWKLPSARPSGSATALALVLAHRVLRWLSHPPSVAPAGGYSTVTLLARLRGLSTSFPSATAAW